MNEVVNFIYNYCTDFIISVAHLLGVSYYEVNAFLFVFLYPIAIVFLVTLYVLQRIRLKRVRKTLIE